MLLYIHNVHTTFGKNNEENVKKYVCIKSEQSEQLDMLLKALSFANC